MYPTHLRPHGMLAFHISNRYFDFVPVFANIAADHHLKAIVELSCFLQAQIEIDTGLASPQWVVLSRDPADLQSVRITGHWHTLHADGALPVWTDDYSSLIRILR